MSAPLTRAGPPPAGAERSPPPRRGGGDLGHLLRGAYSLVVNTVLTGLLGVGFWVLAARVYPQATVGLDSALIALMGTISALCQLNLGNVASVTSKTTPQLLKGYRDGTNTADERQERE